MLIHYLLSKLVYLQMRSNGLFHYHFTGVYSLHGIYSMLYLLLQIWNICISQGILYLCCSICTSEIREEFASFWHGCRKRLPHRWVLHPQSARSGRSGSHNEGLFLDISYMICCSLCKLKEFNWLPPPFWLNIPHQQSSTLVQEVILSYMRTSKLFNGSQNMLLQIMLWDRYSSKFCKCIQLL